MPVLGYASHVPLVVRAGLSSSSWAKTVLSGRVEQVGVSMSPFKLQVGKILHMFVAHAFTSKS